MQRCPDYPRANLRFPAPCDETSNPRGVQPSQTTKHIATHDVFFRYIFVREAMAPIELRELEGAVSAENLGAG